MCVTGGDGWQNNSLYGLRCMRNVGVIKTARTLTDRWCTIYVIYILRELSALKIYKLLPNTLDTWWESFMQEFILVLSELIFVLTVKASICIEIWSFKVCTNWYVAQRLFIMWTMHVWKSSSNNFTGQMMAFLWDYFWSTILHANSL